MTAFTTANIPANINTIERLAAWSVSALGEINPNATIITGVSTAEQVASAYPFNFRLQPTGPERLIIAAYLPLSGNWRSSGKTYTSVVEVSSTALPANYTTP